MWIRRLIELMRDEGNGGVKYVLLGYILLVWIVQGWAWMDVECGDHVGGEGMLRMMDLCVLRQGWDIFEGVECGT